ncbi:MAG: protease complex subunit PrcB family protein [Anaerostipes sp.]|jgi:hypothetical protein|nr:protease complex subunit PrcB family protein [Anaerostipes sp.]
MKMKKLWMFLFIMGGLCFVLKGRILPSKKGTLKSVDYAVCKEENQPVELKKLIQKEKKEAFHFTFTTGDMMYLVVGYGKQQRTNYTVKLDSLKEDKGHIYMNTSLIHKKEHKKDYFPYIVVKCIASEKNVIFQ